MTSTFLFCSRLTRLVLERLVVMVGGRLVRGGYCPVWHALFYSGAEVFKRYELCALDVLWNVIYEIWITGVLILLLGFSVLTKKASHLDLHYQKFISCPYWSLEGLLSRFKQINRRQEGSVGEVIIIFLWGEFLSKFMTKSTSFYNLSTANPNIHFWI